MRDAPLIRRQLRRVSSLERAPLLAAAGVIAAAGLTAVLVAAMSGAAPRPASATNGPTATAPARMVTIDGAALQGRPADAVLGQLRQAGLRPRLAWAPHGHVQPGTVIAVRPAGQLPVGAVVTVTVATASPGHQHGHNNGGGGNGGNANGD